MSNFHADPKRNWLVFHERDTEHSLLASGNEGEREISAEWAFDHDDEASAIEAVLGNRYSLTGDYYTAFALSQQTIIEMPMWTVSMKKRTVYDFEMERSS